MLLELSGIVEVESLFRYARHVDGAARLEGRAARHVGGRELMSAGRAIPGACSHMSDDAVAFAIDVIDASGIPDRVEALLVRQTGRPRTLPVARCWSRVLLLAIDDRALHLERGDRVCSIAPSRRTGALELGVEGQALTKKSLLARYRCVRYLFHLMVA